MRHVFLCLGNLIIHATSRRRTERRAQTNGALEKHASKTPVNQAISWCSIALAKKKIINIVNAQYKALRLRRYQVVHNSSEISAAQAMQCIVVTYTG